VTGGGRGISSRFETKGVIDSQQQTDCIQDRFLHNRVKDRREEKIKKEKKQQGGVVDRQELGDT